MKPKDLNKLHNFLTLVADIIFVNVNLFVFTSEVKLKFVTVKHTTGWTSGQLNKILNRA